MIGDIEEPGDEPEEPEEPEKPEEPEEEQNEEGAAKDQRVDDVHLA